MTTREKGKAWLLAWARFLGFPALFYGVGCFWIAPAAVSPSQRWFGGDSDIAFGAILTVGHIALTAGLYWLFIAAQRGYAEGLKRAAVNPPPHDAGRSRRILDNEQSPAKIRERIMERWLWYS